jgi:uncharacterized protein YbjT (DUF2867 family)
MSTVLVTGATGNVGTHLVPELRRRGAEVRAFVRDEDRARAVLGPDVDLATGEYDDPDSIAAAMRGVDRVFLLAPSHPDMVTWEGRVLDAAEAAGVDRVVKMSTVGADPESPGRFTAWQGRCEERLRASGLPAVVLRSSFHMTNVLMAADTVRTAGRIFAPLADAKIAMVDRRDLAAVAAIALTEDGHDGRTYHVTGPEAITYHDVAAALTQELGRPVEFVDVPEDAAVAAMLAGGAPDWLAHGATEVYRAVRGGTAADTTDVVRVLLRREPYSFGDFARTARDAFG